MAALFRNALLALAFTSGLCRPLHSQSLSAPDSLTFGTALRQHMAILGSDSLAGRGTGTPGGDMAARYIAAQLARWSLAPMGDEGSYFQWIPMHGSRALPASQLTGRLHDRDLTFELGRDYLLYRSGASTFVPQPVPLVFVGYGIIAPEYDYNDYQSQDVEGKIVVFLSGEPPSEDPDYFAGSQPTPYAYAETKQRLAVSRGARGSIMIPSPREEGGRDWQFWINQFAFEEITLLYSVTDNLSVVMSPRAAARLFAGAPFSLAQVFEMEAANAVRSFGLAASMSFRGQFHHRDFLAANVIGMLEGSDPLLKDSFVLLSAHYDHLGIGPSVQGDSIYNGVFDNAAGVGAVLEIAHALASAPNSPKRSIIFLFTTGEEKGLLGASYYADHPVVPLHKTIANVNVDGLALFDTFNDVVGVGTELSTLDGVLERLAGQLGLSASPIPSEFANSDAFTRSDQVAFARAGVPSALIMEGSDYRHVSSAAGVQRMIEWGRQIYHTPFDDLHQPMNLAAAAQHLNMLLAFSRALADSPVTPKWRTGTPFINARLRSIAEKR